MNSREKVLYKLFPEFQEVLDNREYHRKEFFINHNKTKEMISEFSEKLSDMEMVQEDNIIKNFNFNNKRFFIGSITIVITKINEKFISFRTVDGKTDIGVYKKKKYEYTNQARINKIDFYTNLLHREDYKHILRDFFIDQLI